MRSFVGEREESDQDENNLNRKAGRKVGRDCGGAGLATVILVYRSCHRSKM